ncbi:protein GPR107-like isoform X2 [Dendronephthya gigantea]|uniref:protein GPR107-like isoform X2 n=1 Tax=Dendronephthya gigantea TaxID=151771 RepID=UPI00106D2BC4|nr:protein GPR107-like isoform X2 [Dendronephthya gigantea]
MVHLQQSFSNDQRGHVKISTFGILKKGQIYINIKNLTFKKSEDKQMRLGLSIQKTTSSGMATYMEGHTDKCLLEPSNIDKNIAIDLFIFNWTHRNDMLGSIEVVKCGNIFPVIKASNVKQIKNPISLGYCTKSETIPLFVYEPKSSGKISINGSFILEVQNSTEKGLYNTFFHNCHGGIGNSVDMTITVVEENDGNYLSAGDAPLPMVFGFFAVVFSILSCIWFYILRQYWSETFKVHYLMFLLVLLKSLDVLLNAVNYYYIGRDGTKAESWAVLHYIAHLFKGGLLFTTIILLGTGYFFIKHVLSGRDKKIFLIVIPLQIFDNIALIIMESTEEAQADYITWKQIFLLVDLLCCGAVLFPVIWAIRHLKEASQTDGKAAVNLAKLKLFRQFYIMIVCYIYFTRIIVQIVKITVPFQYFWLDEFFLNLSMMALFIMTGYKFRPGSDNPYLHVSQDSDGEEMEEVVTQTGLTENVTRVQTNGDSGAAQRVKMSAA